LNNDDIAQPKSTASAPIRGLIPDPDESLRIVYRERLREGSAIVMTTGTLEIPARMPDREPHVLGMFLPTREEIRRQCSAIRRQWSPGEKARRWRGRSAKGQLE